MAELVRQGAEVAKLAVQAAFDVDLNPLRPELGTSPKTVSVRVFLPLILRDLQPDGGLRIDQPAPAIETPAATPPPAGETLMPIKTPVPIKDKTPVAPTRTRTPVPIKVETPVAPIKPPTVTLTATLGLQIPMQTPTPIGLPGY